MRGISIPLVLCAVLFSGCATQRQWVSVREIAGPEEAIMGQDLTGVPRVKVAYMADGDAVTVDGDLGEWKTADWMVLDRKDQYRDGEWGGPEDLSGRLALGYDADMLYVAAVVTDNVTVWNRTGADIWQADSIQVAIDPWLARNPGGYTADAVEFGFSGIEGEKRAQVWRWTAPAPLGSGALEADTAVAGPSDGEVVYEIAIPLAELGSWRPSLSGMSGGTWLINDNDNGERKGYLEWTPGIGGSKDPSKFGIFEFEAPPPGVELPVMMARFHWERTVAARGRPLEIQVQVLSQGEERTANIEVRFDPDEGGPVERVSFPVEPGRSNFALSFDTEKIPTGKHRVYIKLDDGRGYEIDTARPIYIYEPPEYQY